ncbi:hypothetical protein ACJX0J_040419 [Zea mays]
MDYRTWVLLKQDEIQTMFKIAGYSGFIAAGPSPHYDFFPINYTFVIFNIWPQEKHNRNYITTMYELSIVLYSRSTCARAQSLSSGMVFIDIDGLSGIEDIAQDGPQKKRYNFYH